MSEQTPSIQIFERDKTISASKLRTIGFIPATIYGKNFEPLSVQVQAHNFQQLLYKGHKTFRLEGCGQIVDAQVKHLQKISTKEQVLHIEFWVPEAASKPVTSTSSVAQKSQEPVTA